MRVSLDDTLVGELPDAPARTAYRVVQEALTNARKHAPGTAVTVTLSRQRRRRPDRPRPQRRAGRRTARRGCPDSGLGLIGLDERVALAGGRIRARPGRHGRLRRRGMDTVAGVSDPCTRSAWPSSTTTRWCAPPCG